MTDDSSVWPKFDFRLVAVLSLLSLNLAMTTAVFAAVIKSHGANWSLPSNWESAAGAVFLLLVLLAVFLILHWSGKLGASLAAQWASRKYEVDPTDVSRLMRIAGATAVIVSLCLVAGLAVVGVVF